MLVATGIFEGFCAFGNPLRDVMPFIIRTIIPTAFAYNHATSNLAIYSYESSQDKLPEA